MRVLIVSGIWPPDVGGPASHAPEVAKALVERGHSVEVVTTAAATPPPAPYRVHFVSRGVPSGLRHAAVIARIARRGYKADVIYATSMLGRSVLGAAVGGAPLVVKAAGDPAFERARRRGLYGGVLDDFQRARVGVRARILRRIRTAAIGRTAHVLCPSEFLRQIVLTWGLPPERVTVVPNASPPPAELPPREELRATYGIDGPTLAFAGRLTAAKALDVAFEAIAELDDVTLLVAGDGEERARLEASAGARARFLGPLPRERVLELLAVADAVLLSSSWENFPHVLVEALSVGTPVIATRVGGVPEIVEDGVNGLLVPAGDPHALAAAVRRFYADGELRARLTAAALPSASRFSPGVVMDELEATLARFARTSSH